MKKETAAPTEIYFELWSEDGTSLTDYMRMHDDCPLGTLDYLSIHSKNCETVGDQYRVYSVTYYATVEQYTDAYERICEYKARHKRDTEALRISIMDKTGDRRIK